MCYALPDMGRIPGRLGRVHQGQFWGQADVPYSCAGNTHFYGPAEAKRPEDLKGVDAAIIGAPYVATTHETYAA